MAQGHIMIVDDNPANLKLLEGMLRDKGHEVWSFPLGRLALIAAAESPPDLILLDINMPEMNGYEVCKRLKSDPELADIPVVFLSALNEIPDKIMAFRHGAVDYISKPFQFEEVHARVATHLKVHHLQRALKQQNEQLETVVAERTRELAEANGRLTLLDRSKTEFLKLISHELRSPLHGLLGVSELILAEMPPGDDKIELQQLFQRSSWRILSILDDALLLTQIDVSGEQFTPAAVALDKMIARAVENANEFATSRNVEISKASTCEGYVLGDQKLLERALQALLEASIKFSDDGGIVRVLCDAEPGFRRVLINSGGRRTIPQTELPKFFDLFAIGDAITPGGDLGLGPPMAQRILGLFGATVHVANHVTGGIQFDVALREADPGASFHNS